MNGSIRAQFENIMAYVDSLEEQSSSAAKGIVLAQSKATDNIKDKIDNIITIVCRTTAPMDVNLISKKEMFKALLDIEKIARTMKK